MTYHTVLLSPPFLQGNSHCYPCFQPKLQTSTGGEAAALCLHCAEPGLRSPAEVCGVHPGTAEREQSHHSPLLRCQHGASLLGQRRAETAPGFTGKPCIHFAVFHISHPNSLCTGHLCFLPVPGNAGTGDQQQRIKAPSCTGPCFCSSQGSTGAIQDCHCFKSKQAEKQVAFKSHFVCNP